MNSRFIGVLIVGLLVFQNEGHGASVPYSLQETLCNRTFIVHRFNKKLSWLVVRDRHEYLDEKLAAVAPTKRYSSYDTRWVSKHTNPLKKGLVIINLSKNWYLLLMLGCPDCAVEYGPYGKFSKPRLVEKQSDEGTSASIVPYESSRDRGFIITLFKKEWRWLLLSGPQSYDPRYFDVEYMLDNQCFSWGLSRKGQLLIRTYTENDIPMGFVVYYPSKDTIGHIVFLAVDERSRKKGIGRKLMKYAINDMQRQGMLEVELNVRSDNTRARALYESLGFTGLWADIKYVVLTRSLKMGY